MLIKDSVLQFEKMGFGMFVHYGLYSLLGKGEWAQMLHKIPQAEYDALTGHFAAEHFFASELVGAAKRAGMKYIVFTTRHHDGFSLYDTCGLNDFDAPHSACRRDLVAEFVEECHRQGVKPFFYHTMLDWHEPSYRTDFSAYLRYLRDSVEILCKNYGEVGGFWFDGNWDRADSDWEEDALYGLIRRYQPNAILVNNSGLSKLGEPGNPELDSVTFERGKPLSINRNPNGKYLASEMCQIVNSHWGYAENDVHFKSVSEILSDLLLCRRCNSNFLLNFAPQGDGALGLNERALLQNLAVWMSCFSEAVYCGKSCGTELSGTNFALKGEGCFYLAVSGLHVRGDENVNAKCGCFRETSFSGIDCKVNRVYWMDNSEPLDFSQNGSELCLRATHYDYGRDLAIRIAKAECRP